MPFRRRYKPRRKSRKQYRRKFRRFTRRNIIGNPRQKVFYYKRFCSRANVVAPSTGNDTFFNYDFALNNLPGFSEFTAMYDSYKFCGVKINFLPTYSQQSATSDTASSFTASSWNNLRIFTVIDYNDFVQPVSLNDLRQYRNCKMTQYTRGHKRYFKPMYQEDDVIQTFTYKNPWIATTRSDLGHMAIKGGIDTSLLDTGVITENDVLLRVECQYYIAFKGPN